MVESAFEIVARSASLALRAGLLLWEQVFAGPLFYWTARLVVPVLTFGMASVAPLDHPRSSFSSAGVARRGSRILLSETFAELMGLLFWIVGIGAALAAQRMTA